MSARTHPESSTTHRSRRDPTTSAWVAANAGSGKTHVLTQRVVRLLLAGCDPSTDPLHHLHQGRCGQHGDPRVRASCGEWTALDDAELDQRMTAMGVDRIDARQREAGAHGYSPLALETPGGLKVQTIHAFCRNSSICSRSRPTSPRASRCSTRPPRPRCWSGSRLEVMLEAASQPGRRARQGLGSVAILAAADITFRGRVVRRRSVSATDSRVGRSARAACLKRWRSFRTRSAWNRTKHESRSMQAYLESGVLSRIANGLRLQPRSRRSSRKPTSNGRTLYGAARSFKAVSSIETYLDIFCSKDHSKTKERHRHQSDPAPTPSLVRAPRAEKAVSESLLQRQRAVVAP